MGFWGESRDDKITREAYVLLWNAAERLKQGRAIRENLKILAGKMAWLEQKDFERTADSLVKCGTALACMAAGLLGELPKFRENSLLNVAVPRESEKAILELFFKTEANQIRSDLRDFDSRDDGVPSMSKVLTNILLE